METTNIAVRCYKKNMHNVTEYSFLIKRDVNKNVHALEGTYFQLWTKCRVWSQSMPAENAARQGEVWLDLI